MKDYLTNGNENENLKRIYWYVCLKYFCDILYLVQEIK